MTLDCQKCGACCRGLAVYLTMRESRLFARQPTLHKLTLSTGFEVSGVPERKMRQFTDARCAALRGRIGKECTCSIYSVRPAACRAFEPGCDRCLGMRASLQEQAPGGRPRLCRSAVKFTMEKQKAQAGEKT